MFENAEQDYSLTRKINLVFRFSYTIPFVLASLCGTVLAIGYGGPLYIYAAIPCAVLLLGIFVNFSNDYFDHESGVDAVRFRKAMEVNKDSDIIRKLYWDGNQFDNGNISDREGRILMAVIMIATVLVAIPIVIYNPLWALIFGAAGLFLAYFYTAPPVNLGGRGLGEAAVAVSFFMMSFCPYFLITGTVSIESVSMSVVVALLVAHMRTVDSATGQETHLEIGDRSISTMFGMDAVAWLSKAVIVTAYALVALMAALLDPLYLLAFITLPFGIKAWSVVSSKGPGWEFRAAPLFFGIAVVTEVAFIAVAALQTVL